jgi:putative tryptophan/tyrosine transport system substrate-binding protein
MVHMRRRDFIALVGGAVTWSRAARAQQPAKVFRIFWVSTESEPDPFLDGFRQGLCERGYVDGKNVVFELHYAAGNPAALRQVISELKRGDVDLAVSSGPATRAMTAVTDVPVLFALSGDPVEMGIVKSLGQPGGNFTGSSFLSLELAGKRVELLKEVFPKLHTLAVLSNTDHPGEQSEWRTTLQAAQALGMDPVTKPAPPSPMSDSTKVANAVGWCTPRCSSRVHPRRVVQMTGRIPPGTVEPPSTPLRMPT